MNLNKNRILDAARWRPPQKVIRMEAEKNGRKYIEERIEKRPGIRHRMMLNPAGFVVPVCLGNANAVAEEGRVPYFEQILNRKKALGFLDWGRCPVAMVAAQEIPPRALQNQELLAEPPCMGGHSADNPCPHALAEQAHRKEKHEAKERAKQEAYKAEAERDREQRERHHEELLKSQREVLETIAAQAGGGRKRGGGGGE